MSLRNRNDINGHMTKLFLQKNVSENKINSIDIYYYDPHGSNTGYSKKLGIQNIYNILSKKISLLKNNDNYYNKFLINFDFIDNKQTCSKIGAQTLITDNYGYCTVFSTFWYNCFLEIIDNINIIDCINENDNISSSFCDIPIKEWISEIDYNITEFYKNYKVEYPPEEFDKDYILKVMKYVIIDDFNSFNDITHYYNQESNKFLIQFNNSIKNIDNEIKIIYNKMENIDYKISYNEQMIIYNDLLKIYNIKINEIQTKINEKNIIIKKFNKYIDKINYIKKTYLLPNSKDKFDLDEYYKCIIHEIDKNITTDKITFNTFFNLYFDVMRRLFNIDINDINDINFIKNKKIKLKQFEYFSIFVNYAKNLFKMLSDKNNFYFRDDDRYNISNYIMNKDLFSLVEYLFPNKPIHSLDCNDNIKKFYKINILDENMTMKI